jgi:hypothetical protein
LLDGAAGVFEGGIAAAEDAASTAQFDLLYRQIWPVGGRKRFFVSKARQMSRAQRRALVERKGPGAAGIAAVPAIGDVALFGLPLAGR